MFSAKTTTTTIRYISNKTMEPSTTMSVSQDIIPSPSVTSKSTKVLSQCKICGDRGLKIYVGVMVCSSCKMFFKRNAKINQVQIKCHFDDHCQININNRHICRYCRLKKCFVNGMQCDLLRGSFSKSNQTKRKKKTTTTDSSTIVARTTNPSHLEQFPTLNLLRGDQSTLSVDQWNLLSNLIHCYDEHSGLSIADRFVREQNTLPIKTRFKINGVGEMIASLLAGSRLLFEKNIDFLSLTCHDRSLLLHGKLKYIACLGACFILNAMELYQNLAFYSTAEIIYGSQAVAASQRTGEQIDSDIIFVKLILAIVLFSTLDYTVYTDTSPVNLNNVQSVLRIQDMYTELAWKYLIYKYDYSHAVKCFSKMIQCIFSINDSSC